jgi:hypothetical protein
MSTNGTDRIEMRLRELTQLFNLMDPSPFIDQDLDADAEEFIVGWARELPHGRELELVIHLTTPPEAERAGGTEAAVRHYFSVRAQVKQRELRAMLRRGRASLVIGALFLVGCSALGQIAQRSLPGGWNEVASMGLQIVGWVALWRPVEIYLYDWWPVRNDMRLMQRLARMKVSLKPSGS